MKDTDHAKMYPFLIWGFNFIRFQIKHIVEAAMQRKEKQKGSKGNGKDLHLRGRSSTSCSEKIIHQNIDELIATSTPLIYVDVSEYTGPVVVVNNYNRETRST